MATERVPPEQFLTPADVAARVFVDPKTVSRWAAAGKIPSERTPGGHRRFLQSDVDVLVSATRGPDHLPREPERPSPRAATGSIPAQRRSGSVDSAPKDPDRRDRPLVDTLVAEAVARTLEAQADLAADTARDTADAVAVAAETVAVAAEEARRLRASSTAAAVQGVAARLAAAVDAVAADAGEAKGHVGRAVADAAEHLAVMVAAQDLAGAKQESATAEALHELAVETALREARRTSALRRRASALRRAPGT